MRTELQAADGRVLRVLEYSAWRNEAELVPERVVVNDLVRHGPAVTGADEAPGAEEITRHRIGGAATGIGGKALGSERTEQLNRRGKSGGRGHHGSITAEAPPGKATPPLHL